METAPGLLPRRSFGCAKGSADGYGESTGVRMAYTRSSPMTASTASISSSTYPHMPHISDSQTVNNLGKPGAGNPPVRFDAGAGACRRLVRPSAPAYST
jgi:hypothetical protein